MDCHVYVAVDGEQFDLLGFQRSLSPEACGTNFDISPNSVLAKRKGWKSNPLIVEADGDIGLAVETLLELWIVPLRSIARFGQARIRVVAVYRYVSMLGPKGLYLSKKSISMLSEIGADFDYDQY